MSDAQFVVKYYNRKILMTLDLNQLVHELLEVRGNRVSVEFMPMTADEQEECSTRMDEIAGLIAVDTRFWLFEIGDANQPIRRPDLETRIVDLGRK